MIYYKDKKITCDSILINHDDSDIIQHLDVFRYFKHNGIRLPDPTFFTHVFKNSRSLELHGGYDVKFKQDSPFKIVQLQDNRKGYLKSELGKLKNVGVAGEAYSLLLIDFLLHYNPVDEFEELLSSFIINFKANSTMLFVFEEGVAVVECSFNPHCNEDETVKRIRRETSVYLYKNKEIENHVVCIGRGSDLLKEKALAEEIKPFLFKMKEGLTIEEAADEFSETTNTVKKPFFTIDTENR